MDVQSGFKWLLDLYARADPGIQLLFLLIVLALFIWAVYGYLRKRHQVDEVKVERDRLQLQLRDKELTLHELQAKVVEFKARSVSLEQKLQEHAEERGRLGQQLAAIREDLEKEKSAHIDCSEQLEALQKRNDDLLKVDTDIWAAPPGDGAAVPPFIPRESRRTRFVAFLNLKGGVGKTTLTANLGAAFATGVTGTRLAVLVVDLDYQATLSNRCVSRAFLEDRWGNKSTARQLLADENLKRPAEEAIRPLMVPMDGAGDGAKVIVAHEDLDHMDFRQQARFVVERFEVRFFHRKLLHDPYVFRQFDLVFFDCPPRLSTSAVNALAVSDWIVVPTSLHPNDSGAVTRTLQWLGKLQSQGNFQAQLAGVVLNRMYRGGTLKDLTKDEKQNLVALQHDLQRYEPRGNAILNSVVPNNPDVARYAAGSVPMGTHEDGHQLYGDVARLLYERIRR